MGNIRKQRNGADANKLRELKRQQSAFTHNGITDWKAIENAANKLLPWMPIIERPDGSISGEVIRLDTCAPPSGQSGYSGIHSNPLSDKPIVYEEPKQQQPGYVCARCGKPKGGAHCKSKIGTNPNALCRSCYRERAQEKRQEWTEGYAFLNSLVKLGAYANTSDVDWMYRIERYVDDFSVALIDALTEAEEAFGAPLAKWPHGRTWKDLFAEEGKQRRLSFSNDASIRMAHGAPKLDVRRRRPRWKVIRGEWA